MSTTAIPASSPVAAVRPQEISFDDAIEILSREERFMGTVYAMNSLLIHRGVYTQQEFDALFCRWAKTQQERPKSERTGWRFSIRAFFSRPR
jgi:hypothetical protein